MSDSNFSTGAVRSADANDLDFISISPIAMIALAKTCAEGAAKYGAHNYELGMDTLDTINHVQRHLQLWLAGDRSEPHLPHAMWGLMAAIHMDTLHPELSVGRKRGPGCTVTPKMRVHLASGAADRAAKRKAGFFADLSDWTVASIAEIKTILGMRVPFHLELRNARECVRHDPGVEQHPVQSPSEMLREAFRAENITDQALINQIDERGSNAYYDEEVDEEENYPVDLDDDDEEETVPAGFPRYMKQKAEEKAAVAEDDADEYFPAINTDPRPQDMDCDSVTIGTLDNARVKKEQRSGLQKLKEAIGLTPKVPTHYF